MENEISEKFLNTMFACDNYVCHCEKDIENVTPGESPRTTLKLYADQSQPLHFAYTAKEGLNLTGPAGGVIDYNILGKLLAIHPDDIDGHIAFFTKYGFLRPLAFDEYSSVDACSILEVSNHIKATIRLMNAIGNRDYRKMLIHVSYLLFSNPTEYTAANQVYKTCTHPFTQLINNYVSFPDLNQDRMVQATGNYLVADLITGTANEVPISFINAVRSGAGTDQPGSKDPWFKNVVAHYLLGNNHSEDIRLIVDFFFHLFMEHAIYQEVNFLKIKPYGNLNIDGLSAPMKEALVKISRIVLAEEINYNICGIHPQYDGGRLTVSWKVDTLIEAIYFSIFYMKAGIEIYKECENPNCKRDKYFLVEATRTNKKYCCPQCANAAAAQRHRNRQL